MPRRIIGLIASCLFTLPVPAGAQQHGPDPSYRLLVRLRPEVHAVEVRGWVKHLPCARGEGWYLNRGFRVDTLLGPAGGGGATFDTAASAPPYASIARPLRRCPGDSAYVAYQGTLPDTVDGINTIAPGLVELASYAAWYPFAPRAARITYDLTVSLPAGLRLLSNGRQVGESRTGSVRTVHLQSVASSNDIVLVAAPLAVARRRSGRLTIELAGPPDEAATLERDARALGDALAAYRAWYGPVTDTQTVRVVYSPRDGWGYSRLPMIVVSDRYRRTLLTRPGGAARSFEGNAHELAHFWWRIADPRTTDDWINEGLAEYSAFALTGTRFGRAARDSLIAQYRRDAAGAHPGTSIAETDADSRDRYVNRYEKTTLLLARVTALVGTIRMRRFLRTFYSAHIRRRDATTAGFLAAARDSLGPTAASLLSECLHARVWASRCAAQ